MRDGVKFYGVNDMASGHELKDAEVIIESFNVNTEYSNINRVIELYNIKQYFDNEIYLVSWDDLTKSKYITIVKGFFGTIGKFFSKINGDNIVSFWKEVNNQYHSDFWYLIEYFSTYKKISSEQFSNLVGEEYVLNYILYCEKIVKQFGTEIANELTTNIEYAETVLNYYIVKHEKSRRRLYIPTELTEENKISILQKYISWERANPNYLLLISTFKKSDDFVTNDRIRYAAHKKYREYWSKKENTQNVVWQSFGASVSFYDDSSEQSSPPIDHDKNTIELSYGTSWIKENLDYPTLLNNFIYLFGFVDEQFRYQHLANPSKLGTLESAFGVSGRNDYKMGIDYQIRRMSSIGQMAGYLRQLRLYDIKLENIIKWFFESYLVEEFNANGFCYFAPNEQSSWVEKILLLISQFDSVLKQFRYYTEDQIVDREFLQFSSDQYKMSDTPSMLSEKYIYPQSERINSAMHMFYSDQSMLYYIDEENKYNNLPHLLIERNMKVSDFRSYDQAQIEWLIREGFAFLDGNEHVKIKTDVAYLLKDLFRNGVLSFHFYKVQIPSMLEQIEKWLETEDVVSRQSLFTIQEQSFIDYMLNVQKYYNGPELRNKYAHGIFPTDEKEQEQDYLELLRIMILIIIKINEEFCILNPK